MKPRRRAFRKLLAVALCLVLCIGLLPTAAFAEVQKKEVPNLRRNPAWVLGDDPADKYLCYDDPYSGILTGLKIYAVDEALPDTYTEEETINYLYGGLPVIKGVVVVANEADVETSLDDPTYTFLKSMEAIAEANGTSFEETWTMSMEDYAAGLGVDLEALEAEHLANISGAMVNDPRPEYSGAYASSLNGKTADLTVGGIDICQSDNSGMFVGVAADTFGMIAGAILDGSADASTPGSGARVSADAVILYADVNVETLYDDPDLYGAMAIGSGAEIELRGVHKDSSINAPGNGIGVVAASDAKVDVSGIMMVSADGLFDYLPSDMLGQMARAGMIAVGIMASGSEVSFSKGEYDDGETRDGDLIVLSPSTAIGAAFVGGIDQLAEAISGIEGGYYYDDYLAQEQMVLTGPGKLTADNIEVLGGINGIGLISFGDNDLYVNKDVIVGGYDLESEYLNGLGVLDRLAPERDKYERQILAQKQADLEEMHVYDEYVLHLIETYGYANLDQYLYVVEYEYNDTLGGDIEVVKPVWDVFDPIIYGYRLSADGEVKQFTLREFMTLEGVECTDQDGNPVTWDDVMAKLYTEDETPIPWDTLYQYLRGINCSYSAYKNTGSWSNPNYQPVQHSGRLTDEFYIPYHYWDNEEQHHVIHKQDDGTYDLYFIFPLRWEYCAKSCDEYTAFIDELYEKRLAAVNEAFGMDFEIPAILRVGAVGLDLSSKASFALFDILQGSDLADEELLGDFLAYYGLSQNSSSYARAVVENYGLSNIEDYLVFENNEILKPVVILNGNREDQNASWINVADALDDETKAELLSAVNDKGFLDKSIQELKAKAEENDYDPSLITTNPYWEAYAYYSYPYGWHGRWYGWGVERADLLVVRNENGAPKVYVINEPNGTVDSDTANAFLAQWQQDTMEELRAAFAKTETSITVGRDVKVQNARTAIGILGVDGTYDVGGTVSVDGVTAAGVAMLGGTAELGDIEIGAKTAGAGIATINGEITVDGHIKANNNFGASGRRPVVPAEESGVTGVLMSGGDVTVNGDVTANGRNGVGATLLSLDKYLLMLVTAGDIMEGMPLPSEQELSEEYEGWNGQIYKDYNVSKILSLALGDEDAFQNTLTVDGTIAAQDGIAVVNNKTFSEAMRGFWRMVFDLYNDGSGDWYGASWMDGVTNEKEFNAKWDEVMAPALEDVVDANPDITVWEIIPEDGDYIKHGKGRMSVQQITLMNVLQGDFGGGQIEEDFLSLPDLTTPWTFDYDDDFADEVQADVNYIVRELGVFDTEGNKHGTLVITAPNPDHHGFKTAKEGETVTITAEVDPGYRIVSVETRRGEAVKTRAAGDEWTLEMPRGGGVEIKVVVDVEMGVEYEWTGADTLDEELPVDDNVYAGAEEAIAAMDTTYTNESTAIGSDDVIYRFSGWEAEEPDYVNRVVKFTGEWLPGDQFYTVVYTDGVDDEEVFPNQETRRLFPGDPTPPFGNGEDPTREGWVFDGWDPTVGRRVDPEDATEGNVITYTATWKKLYKVVYTDGVDDEEIFADQPYEVVEGSYTPAFVGSLVRNGYVFKDWEPEIVETVSADDADENGVITYTAQWEELPKDAETVIVTYDDGVEDEELFHQEIEAKVGDPTPAFTGTPEREGYTFAGWEPELAETVSANDATEGVITYTAKWEEIEEPEEPKEPETFTVTFDANGKDNVLTSALPGPYTVISGETIPNPGVITAEGYTFVAWCEDEDGAKEVSFPYMVENDTVFYASWKEIATYTITYIDDLTGEVLKEIKDVAEGSRTPAYGRLPQHDGYTFDRWEPEIADTVTADATYTAMWKKAEKPAPSGGGGGAPSTVNYILTYASNGGTNYQPERYADGVQVALDKIPTREGYEFTGWYLDEALTQLVTSVTMNSDKTVYAGWKDNGTGNGAQKGDLNFAEHFAYVMGYPDDTFRPQKEITRAEAATMIYRMLTNSRRDEIFTVKNNFSDVTAELWYNKAVSSMANGGYIKGYPDGTFNGGKCITRAEFISIMVRFFEQKDLECKYSDVTASHWAYAAIATATANGWINGYIDGTFRPDSPITRAEAVAILNRVLERGVNASSMLGNFQNFTDNADPNAWYYYEIIEAANGHDYAGKRPNENWTSNVSAHEYDIAKYERP